MPKYRFVGAFETVLHGLQHGVNAELHRYSYDGEHQVEAEHGQPDLSTVVAGPGDVVETTEPYVNANLEPIDEQPGAHAAPEVVEAPLPEPVEAPVEQPVEAPAVEPAESVPPAESEPEVETGPQPLNLSGSQPADAPKE